MEDKVMIDKSLNVFFIMLLAAGGIVILVVTWIQPMPISERIVPSFFGVMGVILALIWSLISRSKSAKVRVTGIPDKTSVKKENY
jgi:hypothetical protein